MELKEFSCPNCKAALTPIKDAKYMFCDYCGTRIFIDNIEYYREDAKTERERIRTDAELRKVYAEQQAKVELQRLKYNTKIELQRLKRKDNEDEYDDDEEDEEDEQDDEDNSSNNEFKGLGCLTNLLWVILGIIALGYLLFGW